jgi:hypothetical protein
VTLRREPFESKYECYQQWYEEGIWKYAQFWLTAFSRSVVRQHKKEFTMTQAREAAWHEASNRLEFNPDAVFLEDKNVPERFEEVELDSKEAVIKEVNSLKSPAYGLPKPIAFAFNNLHKMDDPDDPTTWAIRPSQAPDRACWNMLELAARNKTKFMDMVTKEMMNVQRNREDYRRKRMMARIKDKVNSVDKKKKKKEDENIGELDDMLKKAKKDDAK